MKIFIGHSFSENLNQDYYELVKQVYQTIYDSGHDLLVGGLLANLSEVYKKVENRLTCYSITKYQEEKKYAPRCHYTLVEDTLLRTKQLVNEADLVLFMVDGKEELSASSNKKIYLLNLNNHYDLLLKYLEELEKKDFNKKRDINYLQCITLEQIKDLKKEGI